MSPSYPAALVGVIERLLKIELDVTVFFLERNIDDGQAIVQRHEPELATADACHAPRHGRRNDAAEVEDADTCVCRSAKDRSRQGASARR